MQNILLPGNTPATKEKVFNHQGVRPLDRHNIEWAKQAHPLDWVNPEPDGRYNLLVVGAGPAGLVAAAGAAGLGAKVALVEKNLMGGDCLNFGCVPSKALLRSAKAVGAIRDASAYGVEVAGQVRVDFGRVMERMRNLRAEISHHDAATRFRDLGIDVYLGTGRFTGRDVFEIDGKALRFAKACVTTGARAVAPKIPGFDTLDPEDHLTNETLFSLTDLPRRLGVIGAGVIGSEMAQAFCRFGSEVYVVKAEQGILTREDPEAAAVVEKALLKDGIRFLGHGKSLRVDKQSNGVHLKVDLPEVGYDVTVDKILVSVGRKTNTENLGLESADVQFDKRGIKVNDRLQTTNPNIFAAGDVASAYKFTHAADAFARIVIQNALFFGRKKASALTIPWCTYTDPELAHVGHNERTAKEAGIEIDTFKVRTSETDRGVLDGETDGFIKVHVRKGSDEIMGATIVARNAGDMIPEITMAMTFGRGLGALAGVIHPYPTVAEMIKKAGVAYNRTRLTPGLKVLFGKVLGWRR